MMHTFHTKKILLNECFLFFSCDIPKKDLEESQDASEKGPDIIPMSKDSEGELCFSILLCLN